MENVQQISESLSLTLEGMESIEDTKIVFRKSTGGKIVATWTPEGFSVYGIPFPSENPRDSLYWAVQWAAHCR